MKLRKIILFLILISCSNSLSFGEESRKKVAIIDTGIDPSFSKYYMCLDGNYDVTGEGIRDNIYHGTIIANLIGEQINPMKTCITIIKYYALESINHGTELLKALKIVSNGQYSYVNLSSGGNGFSTEEKRLMELISQKADIFVAAGNSSQDLRANCDYYPACDFFPARKEHFHVVGACTKDGKMIESYSNIGQPPITNFEYGGPYCWKNICMHGTSFSTAIETGKFIHNHE